MILLRILFLPLRLPIYIWHKLTSIRHPGDVLMHRIPEHFVPAHPSGFLSIFTQDEEMTFTEYLSLLDFFEKNTYIRILVFQASHISFSWSQVEEVARRLKRISESGKEIIGYSEGGSLKCLYLLSMARRRMAAPHASFLGALPSGESFFVKDTLALFGIRLETSFAGKFKAGGFETFTRNTFSKEGKASMQRLLLDFRRQMTEPFTQIPLRQARKTKKSNHTKKKARKSDTKGAKNLGDLVQEISILSARRLEEAGFLEARLSKEELFDYLFTIPGRTTELPTEHRFTNKNADTNKAKDSGSDAEEIESLADWEDMQRRARKRLTDERRLSKKKFKKDYPIIRLRSQKSLALVTLNGPIHLGKSSSEPQLDSIQALPLRPVFEELLDSREEAIFLLINSPGGSADASELLYQSIQRLAQKKPVFAILGGVAASGGYYIACAANQIYASGMSLVGSIGVIRLRPEISGLYKKLKVNKQKIFSDPTADIFSEAGPLSPRSRKLNQEGLNETYDLFLERVMEGRSLPEKRVLEMAEGQIFTGKVFDEAGMIDGCLDLYEVIDLYRREAGYKEGTQFALNLYPAIKLNLRTMFQSKYGSLSLRIQDLFGDSLSRSLLSDAHALQLAFLEDAARPLLLAPGLFAP